MTKSKLHVCILGKNKLFKNFNVVRVRVIFHCQIIEKYENLLICRLKMLFKDNLPFSLLFCKKKNEKKRVDLGSVEFRGYCKKKFYY
jgi:hypothetical protein